MSGRGNGVTEQWRDGADRVMGDMGNVADSRSGSGDGDDVRSDGRSLVIDRIGSLITNDPTIGAGPLGIVEDASVVITDGLVESVGPAGAIADERRDGADRVTGQWRDGAMA